MPLPVFVLFIPGVALVLLIQVIICHAYQFRITYIRPRKKKKVLGAGPKSAKTPKNTNDKAKSRPRQDQEQPMNSQKTSKSPNTKHVEDGRQETTIYPVAAEAPSYTMLVEAPSRSSLEPDPSTYQSVQEEPSKPYLAYSNSHDHHQDYLNQKPNRGCRRKSIFAESYDPAKDDEELNRVVHEKTEEEKGWLKETVKELTLFKHLANDQISTVVDAMYKFPTEAGDYICKQNSKGNQFFVVQKGIYDVFLKSEDNETETLVKTYDNVGSFGELALLYNQPRAASVVARTGGLLWAVDGDTFRRIVYKITYQKRQMYEYLITNVPMLQELELYERANLVDALVPRSYEHGEVIFKQGDNGDGMYFIVSGGVRIVMTTEDNSEMLLKELSISDYFGELALVTDKPRAASAYTVGNTNLAFLDRKAFERLLGPCMEILRRNIIIYNNQLNEIENDMNTN